MSAAILAAMLLAAEPRAADAVLVAPREFLPALKPLIEHRQKQGHGFVYVPTASTPEGIRSGIRDAAKAGGLKFALLVGDAEPAARVDRAVAARCVPAHLEKAVVNVKWGSEPQIASDNWYADLNDDQLPDLAIGRIPADTPAEVARIVAKILAYEQSADFGPWRERVNLIAGVGGFSPILDTVLETATSKLLTSGIPAGYETRMTYGSWRSPYCPDPRLFHLTAVERHNEGCLFWIYIGHGSPTALDQVSVPGERFHIFDVDDCQKLKSAGGAPIALMLACYTAAFDQPQDCLAEELLKADGGPVAVYGGSRVTMPYAMGVMGTAMMDEYFKTRPPTLGEVVLAAKRKMVQPIDETNAAANLNRVLLDGVAAVISPSREMLDAERREHLHLFHLIGDPMLRLTYPDEIGLSAPRDASAGAKLRISGRTKMAGPALLELVCRRDQHKVAPPARERFDPTDKALAAFQGVYEQALDRCWARWALDLPAGEFATDITLPAECRGPCHFRLLVANGSSYGLGATSLYIRQPEAPTQIAQPAANTGAR
ncbi:MAG TPA: C25 family cysteine peptidase [Pirellulaceae bacterium]|nr:C25 family cysteine peptidase [Pirellulaceae bacterium]